MMQGNIDISELYDSGTISGETYLYCVEHDIDTTQDLHSSILADASELVLAELTGLISENQNLVVGYSVQDSDANSVLCEGVIEYDSVFDNIVACLDTSIQSFIHRLIDFYGDKKTLYDNLLVYATVESLPICEGVERHIINTVLNIAYDLQMYGRRYSLFDEVFRKCDDVRSTNVLRSRYEFFGNKLEFVHWILNCEHVDLYYLRNCGRKSCGIIWTIIKEVREIAKHNDITLSDSEYKVKVTEGEEDYAKEEVERFRLLIESRKKLLSVRAANVLDGIVDHCHGSYEEVLRLFKASNFVFFSFKNCGRKTNYELVQFKQEVLAQISSTSLEDLEQDTKCEQYKSRLSQPEIRVQKILALEEELGYFPLFNAIQNYIDNLPAKDHLILNGMLDIYNGQELEHRDVIGETLKLSGERVRQLRGKVFARLRDYILSISREFDAGHYSLDKINEINFKEKTNFQDNFIYWVLSICCRDRWVIVGDAEEVFYNPHGHQVNLNIVPALLFKAYDFSKFVRDFNVVYNEKRTIASELNLQSFCLKFFKGSIQIALLSDIIYECKKIVLRLYECTSNGDIIYLDSNAYRGLSEISEEILREHGSPMTAEEMYAVLIEKYPNQRCKGASSLVGSIHNNPNIRPIGRSRTFSLKEWNIGETRGGTIREFAEEYILMQPDKIAQIEAVGNYIRQFRTTSSDASIQSNLLAEATGKFAMYVRDGLKYVGFSGREYESTYILLEETRAEVRSFETSARLFTQFVEEHGRFPFYAKGDEIDEEEKRLRRFWNNTIYRAKRGDATEDDLKFIKEVEDAYPYHDIPRNEYKWRETHKSICDGLSRHGRDSLTSTEQNWCYKYLRMLKQGQLEDWQVPLMIKLESLYA